MHIQDGYLSTQVCLATGAVSAGAFGYSLHRMKDSLADRTVPLTGMMASLIFAGQMINFPIGLPVSGHLMGGVLAAAILGPYAGCVALTLVLVAQWALFSDGGLVALGANVLHMAVLGSIGGYAIMTSIRKLCGGGIRGTVAGAVIAAWLCVLAAAALFCLEFRLSHASTEFDFANVFTLMVSLHSLIGIGEALITGFVLSMILQQRPDLVHYEVTEPSTRPDLGRFLIAAMVVTLAIGAFASPFASSLPDGLDSVAEKFSLPESENTAGGWFDDYDQIPLGAWQSWSLSLSGIVGCITVFSAAMLIGRTARIGPKVDEPADGSAPRT
jgi:cobalt/nickel transport system permease protein